ncbi:MAG: hypothetical protein H6Q70_2971 [Firmicutes bacterium]|nr:hypothetical protein [Bacillota bacterium]
MIYVDKTANKEYNKQKGINKTYIYNMFYELKIKFREWLRWILVLS